MRKKKNLTPTYSLVQGSFWMSFCIAVCFAAVHLQSMGFSNTELGLVMAVGNVLGTVLGPVLTALAEKHPRWDNGRLCLPLFLLRALCLVELLLLPEHSLLTAAVYTVYMAVTIAVNSLNLKFCVDAEQKGLPLDYGIARGIGSLCFVLLSVLLGRWVENQGTPIIVYTALVLIVVQLLSQILFLPYLKQEGTSKGRTQTTDKGQSTSLLGFFRREPRFSVLLLGALLLFFAHNSACNFMINLSENVGGNTKTMGNINGFMAAMEIPVMLLFSRFAKGKPMSLLLRISVVAFLLKSLAIALASNIPLLFAAHVLQAPAFALFSCAIVPYITRVISPTNAAKAQSLAFSVTTMGAVLSSLIAGPLYDICSVRTTLLIATAACAVGVVICFFGIKKTEA
ncbi:MAG: MFS transporter [Oscillospiraceae bacterium]|nr:MFS transporter [Oscillospiraceae bacterium]